MKKIITITFLLNCLLLLAQEAPKEYQIEENLKKNIIRIEPLPLITKGMNLSYERLLSPKRSIHISTFFRNYREIKPNTDNLRRKDLEFNLGYNFYLSKKKTAPYGWHIGPRIGYSKTIAKSMENIRVSEFSDFSAGGEIGYQLGFGKNKNFLFDIAGGYLASFPIETSYNTIHTFLDINLRIGYLF